MSPHQTAQQMGFGEQIYYTIANELGHLSYGLALALLASTSALYMLDADEWTSHCGSVFLDICVLVIVCGVVLLVLLVTDEHPYGMVCLFAVFHPLWLLALKLACYDGKGTRTFVSWLSGPLLLVSLLIGLGWVGWVFYDPDNEWNILARVVVAERTGCAPNFVDFPECRKEGSAEEACVSVEKGPGGEAFVFPDGCDRTCTGVYGDCLNGFILWLGPVLISLTTFFLSFFCTFLRTEGAQEKDVLNFGAVWMFLLFAMWVTTSLAGTSAGVTAALAALTLASFVASSMFVAVVFSKEERSHQLQVLLDRLNEKYGKQLDIARGLFVVTCTPFVFCYLVLSMINQLIRRARIFPCSQPGEDGRIFTTRTRKQIEVMKSWDRAKVFTIATYWGIAFMVLQVLVATMTTVLLSWMIEKTAGYSLAVVTAIMSGVGVLMFLLPPVPGVPVYLALGIVLPAQGHQLLGWAGSIFYSVGVGLVLKLFSSMLQQKGIGQNLSHYVQVRQFVGINSKLMKAMRLVLSKDGLSIPKVAILVGGPDWPTSVLCGIMRLSLCQILLGTVPIVILILPTCLTGALLYMASVIIEDTGNPAYPWAGTVSTITASGTAIVQFGSMIVAAYYLEQTASKQGDDIQAIPDDRAVKEADDKAEHLKRFYRAAMQWDVVPVTAKLVLQTALGCIIGSCYMVQIFSARCFIPHSLTDSIEYNLDGNVLNLLLPLGWVAVCLFCVSIMLIYLFELWGQQKAHKLANGAVILASPECATGETSIGAEYTSSKAEEAALQ